MSIQNPVIVIPAITGSELRDEYPVDPQVIWSAVLHKQYERGTLHPDDIRFDLLEPARVRANALFPLIYSQLIEELRYNLADSPDKPVPVFPFAYDWRQPLVQTEALLKDFIAEVIGRTKLLRHYYKSKWMDDPRVNLVGHSMGGLVIAGYLQGAGALHSVGKVATLGTPFQGSFEAVLKVVTGTASLGSNGGNSREREAARLTPALYHLVPDFDHAVVDPNGQPVDLFKVDAWQPGVIETLVTFISTFGRDPARRKADLQTSARQLLQTLLDQAAAHRARVRALDLASIGMDMKSWLAVIGIRAVTRVQLLMRTSDQGLPIFDLRADDRRDEWTPDFPSVRTGDQTVPYLGAKPPFLHPSHLVCVQPSDLGYFEMGDRVLRTATGLHGLLPNMNLVQRLVVAHFTGVVNFDNVWGMPAPDVNPSDWDPPVKGLRVKIKG